MVRSWMALAALLATTVYAQSVTVSAVGKADFRTLQEAVDRAPDSGETIRIAPGRYREKVHISKANIHLIGAGKAPSDVVLSFGDSSKSAGGTSKSASVTVDADGFMAENLTIENSWPQDHPDPADRSQAVALLVSSDRAVLDRVHLLSAQDTLYANSRSCREETTAACLASREFFHDCFITGEVDYIFGDAKAVFQACELHSQLHSMVTVTAQSKHYPAEDSGYIFLGCRITGANGVSKLYFGRPWRDYSTVLFYDTDIQQTMEPAGWIEWAGRLKTSTYLEYKSHGPGVNATGRILTAPPLSAEQEKALTPNGILGQPDNWNPEAEIIKLRNALRP